MTHGLADIPSGGGVTPIIEGGTGQITQVTAFDALSPNTTKGDIIVNDGTNDIRLPVGVDGQPLQADSTEPSGVKWGEHSNQRLQFNFDVNGALSAGSLIDAGRGMSTAMTIVAVTLFRGANGSGGTTTVDLNINGVTAYSTQANRPVVTSASGDNQVILATLPDVLAVIAGDYLSMDVDTIETGGGVTAPQDLSLVVELEVD